MPPSPEDPLEVLKELGVNVAPDISLTIELHKKILGNEATIALLKEAKESGLSVQQIDAIATGRIAYTADVRKAVLIADIEAKNPYPTG